MKKKLNYILYLFFILALLGCGNRAKEKIQDNICTVKLNSLEVKTLKYKVIKNINDENILIPIDAVIADKYIYVLDQKSYKLIQLDKNSLKVLKTTGRKGKGPGDFAWPKRIKKYKDNIYVYEVQEKRIHIFDSDCNFIEQIRTNIDVPTTTGLEFFNDSLWFSGLSKIRDLKHRIVVYDIKGQKLLHKLLRVKTQKIMSFNTMLLSKSDNFLWAVSHNKYHIIKINNSSQIVKIYNKKDVIFKDKYKKVNLENRNHPITLKMNLPLDRSIFFEVYKKHLYYVYSYKKEMILDIINNDKIIKSYSLKGINKILGVYDRDKLLVSLEDSEEPNISIIKISE